MSATPPDSNFRAEQACASDESIQQVHAQLRKVRPDKPDGYAALPLIVLSLMCLAIFLGSIYTVHYSVRFDPLVYNPHASREKPGAIKVQALTSAQKGKKVFTTICATCHQATGLGVPGVYPPLAGSEWAQGDEQRVIRIVLSGLKDPITVKGTTFNNVMTPQGATLKDDQIADVLNYVRSEWGNKVEGEITPETVAKVRADTASRTTYWTAEELLKIGK